MNSQDPNLDRSAEELLDHAARLRDSLHERAERIAAARITAGAGSMVQVVRTLAGETIQVQVDPDQAGGATCEQVAAAALRSLRASAKAFGETSLPEPESALDRLVAERRGQAAAAVITATSPRGAAAVRITGAGEPLDVVLKQPVARPDWDFFSTELTAAVKSAEKQAAQTFTRLTSDLAGYL